MPQSPSSYYRPIVRLPPPPKLPDSFGRDINENVKLLFPDKVIEIDVFTDDNEGWCAEILALCEEPCSECGKAYYCIMVGDKSSFTEEGAWRDIHEMIKDLVVKKYGFTERVQGVA